MSIGLCDNGIRAGAAIVTRKLHAGQAEQWFLSERRSPQWLTRLADLFSHPFRTGETCSVLVNVDCETVYLCSLHAGHNFSLGGPVIESWGCRSPSGRDSSGLLVGGLVGSDRSRVGWTRGRRFFKARSFDLSPVKMYLKSAAYNAI